MFTNKYVLIAFTVATALISFYAYNLNESNKSLRKEIVMLDLVNQGLLEEGGRLQSIINEQSKLNLKLMRVNEDYRKKVAIFDKHNFEQLSKKKPKLMERRVNEGTKKIIIDIACATGSNDRLCQYSDSDK